MPDQPRNPAATRQARYRRRNRWLLTAVQVDIDMAAVTSWLIDVGFLAEADAGNDERFRAALERAIAHAAGARFPLRRYGQPNADAA